jgi:probable F420-dependent oxidoreductase
MTELRNPGISIMLSGFHRMFGPDPRHIIDAAKILDDRGVHELLLGDHVVIGGRTDQYPYGEFAWRVDDQSGPLEEARIRPDEPWPEPLTLLTAIAAVTSRLRLGTGILIAPLRPAALLAKTAATLDVISGGRLELGVGVGWQPAEYTALGLEYADRWRLLDETMLACRRMWEDVPASYHGSSANADGIYCVPQPVQARLPVWLGAAATAAAARRIARYADGWFPLTAWTPDTVAAGAEVIREAMAAAGRDPAELRIRVPLVLKWNRDGSLDGPATMEPADALAQTGVTLLWAVIGPHLELSTMAEVSAFVGQLMKATDR